MPVNLETLSRALVSDFPVKVKGLYPYQVAGVEYICRRRKVLLADEMGCIEGDAIVTYNRAGISRRTTLRELYQKQTNPSPTWRSDIQTKLRCYYQGELRSMPMTGIYFRGTKEVLQVKTTSGKVIRATPDHEFLTPTGWVVASALKSGDVVLTNGKQVCPKCGGTEKLITYQYSKFKGHCKPCMYALMRKNGREKQGYVLHGTDGYSYATGFQNHPYATRYGPIPLHRMILEAHNNGMTLEEWKELVKLKRVRKAQCIPPNMHVHHKNRDRNDNRIENLELLGVADHAKEHQAHRHIPVFIPKQDMVECVEPAGSTDVYDVTVPLADSFVANGFIVHNCGKTCQVIAALYQLNLNYLVICPASLRDNWIREIKQWTGIDAQKFETKKAFNPNTPIVATYGQCVHSPAVTALLKHNFTALVCDEAHFLKNPLASRTQKILNKNLFLGRARDAIIFLTGTPVENKPIEIYQLVHALGAIPESLSEFGHRYATPKLDYWSRRIQYEGVKNAPELAKRLRSQCMVRRTKAEVLPFLPPKVKREITLDVNPRELLARELKYYGRDHLTAVEVEDLRNIRAQLAIIKAPYVIEYVRDALEASEKVVVFAWHRTLLTELLIAFAADATIITGSTPNSARQGRVDSFQRNPKCRVFLGALTAAGVGFNMVAAHHVIIAEASWKPGENEQAIDRCHRIGQRHSVLADFLCFPNSADQRVLKACKEKQSYIDAILS